MSVRLSTFDASVLGPLRRATEEASCELSVVVSLHDATQSLAEGCFSEFTSMTCIDLKRTALTGIPDLFAAKYPRPCRFLQR